MEKINLKKEEIEKCKIIDIGFESVIHNYNGKAAKLFLKIIEDEKMFDLKQKKLELIQNKKLDELIDIYSFIYDKNEFIAYLMENLEDYKSLDKIPLNINQILYLFIELYIKLNNLHNNGIIVYDLKMKNIMVDKNLNSKFCDVDSMGIDNYKPEHINLKRNLNFHGLKKLDREKKYKELDLLLLFYTFVNCCINQYYMDNIYTLIQQKFINFNQLNMLRISNELKNNIYEFLSGKEIVKSNEQFIKILKNETNKRP